MPRKPAYKFTRETYYDEARPHLSQSAIKVYLQSPRLYKALYVDKTISRETSDAMTTGKYFDALLSEPEEAKKFYIKKPRSQDKSPYALSEANFEEAEAKAAEVARHPFWRPEAIEVAIPLEAAIMEDGRFMKVADAKKTKKPYVLVCALIDGLERRDGFFILSDFKSSNANAIKSSKSWFYHAIDMGYHYQFAMYREMVRLHYGIENVICANIALAMVKGLPVVKLYGFSDTMLDEALKDLVRGAWNIQNEWYPSDLIRWEDTQLCDAWLNKE